jgi:hypothetical protein
LLALLFLMDVLLLLLLLLFVQVLALRGGASQ